MKELNLYPLKRKKIKLTTFALYIVIMLLPSVISFYMLDLYWKKAVDSYNGTYKKFFDIIGYKLSGTKQDITVLKRASESFKIKATVLKARQKETADFIKKSYVSKKILKEVFNFWKTQKDEWMVLKELQWENGALNIDLYRLYDPGSAKNLDMLKLSLKELGNLKSEVIFNVNFIDSTKLERVVLTLNVPSN
ncbi:MAG: hypothetical protein J7L34_03135 [Thermotogaceae bacterium]|nr:hypothetical protein [Thermotogaceae bacterium]